MQRQRQGARDRDGLRPVEAVRLALERAIADHAGLVSLRVSLQGPDGRWMHRRASLARTTWPEVWHALALDPEDADWEGDGQPAPAQAPPGDRFTDDVATELERARARFPALHSAHEGLAVLLEEYREVETLVFSRTVDEARLYAELVQVAAMAQSMAEDLAL